MAERFVVTPEPLDAAALEALVGGPGGGAVATFVGRVRANNAGRTVLWLDYEAFAPLAVATFERIAAEPSERWPEATLAIAHRIGRLAIGDASVIVAAARRTARRVRGVPLRDRARETDRPDLEARALRRGRRLDRGSDADPTDEAAREAAVARACS